MCRRPRPSVREAHNSLSRVGVARDHVTSEDELVDGLLEGVVVDAGVIEGDLLEVLHIPHPDLLGSRAAVEAR